MMDQIFPDSSVRHPCPPTCCLLSLPVIPPPCNDFVRVSHHTHFPSESQDERVRPAAPTPFSWLVCGSATRSLSHFSEHAKRKFRRLMPRLVLVCKTHCWHFSTSISSLSLKTSTNLSQTLHVYFCYLHQRTFVFHCLSRMLCVCMYVDFVSIFFLCSLSKKTT